MDTFDRKLNLIKSVSINMDDIVKNFIHFKIILTFDIPILNLSMKLTVKSIS